MNRVWKFSGRRPVRPLDARGAAAYLQAR